MNTKIPRYVHGLVAFEGMRAQAAAYGINRGQLSSDAMLRFLPVLAAIVAGFVVCALVAFAPAKRTDALKSGEQSSLSEEIRHNTEALKRSRAWWEGYGRRHLQARRSGGPSTMGTD